MEGSRISLEVTGDRSIDLRYIKESEAVAVVSSSAFLRKLLKCRLQRSILSQLKKQSPLRSVHFCLIEAHEIFN